MKKIKGPAIFLAQFVADKEPFNSLDNITKWASSLGYKGVQIPSWDSRLIDLSKAAESKSYCDDIKDILNKNNKHGSNGAKLFLAKWGITIKFFKRFYLKSDTKYDLPLSKPKIDLTYLYNLIICKINYLYVKIFYSKI